MTPIRFDIPLTPDQDTGRQWLETELSQAVYQQSEGLFARIQRFFMDWLESFDGSVAGTAWSFAGLLALGLLIIGFAYFRMRGKRLITRAEKTGSIGVDQDISADEYLNLAREAAATGSWHDAAVAQFRALVKSAEERVIISVDPSRTALEAANTLRQDSPELEAPVTAAAHTFDAVVYGHDDATRRDYDTVVAGYKAAQEAFETRRKERVNAS